MNFTAIDFETANAQRSSACAIGLAMVEDGKLYETRHFLIKPTPYYFNGINTSIHGIRAETVADAQTFEELWQKLKPYLENRMIIAHNAAFDMSVLRYSLDAYGLLYPELEYACSLVLARKLLPGRDRYNLAALSASFGIPLQHHQAESDATACAQIVLKLAEQQGTYCMHRLVAQAKYRVGWIQQSSYAAFCGLHRKQKTQLKPIPLC